MASRIEHQSPMTLGGVAAMCAAIGLCALGVGQQTRATPASPTLMLALLGCATGLIIILVRVRLPPTVKMGCILAMLSMMFITVATGDAFGVKPTTRTINKASSGDTTDDGSAGGARATVVDPVAHARPGAAVRLVSASQGDLGWASRINGALDGHIGGDSSGWLRIDGRVSAQADRSKLLVMVDWSVGGADRSVRCGSTSISGRDQTAILDQLRATFDAAAIRSNSEGRASCL
ncbi:MAG TPA: hypothetical protein VKQ09_00880 [Sphingomonas sp.]|nr:hypothetical protein [Sphingomonas sp.]